MSYLFGHATTFIYFPIADVSAAFTHIWAYKHSY